VAERTTVYLPGGLLQRAREADLNLSSGLADWIRQHLAAVEQCPHDNVKVRCQDCGADLDIFDEEPGDEPPAPAEPEPEQTQ
jgi:hypothetical protein